MTVNRFPSIILMLCLAGLVGTTRAETHYVWQGSPSPTPPYTNWQAAAHVIQDAVNASSAGDTVLVTNGMYTTGGRPYGAESLTNRVNVTKRITLRSVNGPKVTFIVGAPGPGGTNGPGAVRGVYLVNDAVLDGFTVSNGHTGVTSVISDGGGVNSGPLGVISNCIIVCNSAAGGGGGVYRGQLSGCTIRDNDARNGGGTYRANPHGCLVVNNTARLDGGGVYLIYGSCASDCLIADNEAGDEGGGVYVTSMSTVLHCRVVGNVAHLGGGVCMGDGAVARRCVVAHNSGRAKDVDFGEGGGLHVQESQADNCLIYGNRAEELGAGGNGGGVFCDRNGVVANCTVIGNNADLEGGGVFVKNLGTVRNSIILSNSFNNCSGGGGTGAVYQFCLAPSTVPGPGNTNLVPVFVDPANEDYHLAPGSPGIDRGTNALAAVPYDQAGSARIINQRVDIGAYEYVPLHMSSVTEYYVSPTGGNQYPFTAWASAAHAPQDAIDAAQAGDTVRIAPGSYDLGWKTVRGMRCRVALLKGVTVIGTNLDPTTAVITGARDLKTGGPGSNAVRCAYLTNGAVLARVTLRDGCSRAEGSSSYEESGGGALLDYGGVLSNCVAVNNHADRWGGGVYCYEGGEVFGCVLSSNYATWGGGARCYLGGLVNRCIVQDNVAGNGAGVQIQYRGNVRSSLVTGNAGNLGGGVNLNYGGAMENCTVCDNTATTAGGGLYCNNGGSNVNSIVYYNLSPSGANCFNADDEPFHMHCNTTPAITGTVAGPLIITNAPQFVDRGQGDYRLLMSSSCIDAGTNMPWMIGAKDLDGNERIYDGVVDIGAYEWVPEPCGGIAALALAAAAVIRARRALS